ncbi:hypothetical protein MHBO_001919 [Bonamia ostreae]|uniref:Uncharacterized protein n=1 Tax=Bonamia ostreae TaxID=126728 RepID=A0ABV2ALF3_9EUKA
MSCRLFKHEKFSNMRSSFFRENAKEILFFLNLKKCSFNLSLILNDEMKYLNNLFRQKDKATDILSFRSQFDATESKSPKQFLCQKQLGDIYIAPFYFKQKLGLNPNCNLENCALKVENYMRLLIVHGFLHLVGWDHSDEMETMENIVLERCKIKSPKHRLFGGLLY